MPVLRIKNGPDKGKVIPIGDEPLTVGRDASESIQILDQGASRRHAEIFKIGEMVFMRDLNSKNGSFVNDERVTEELLQIGDKLKIGTTVFVFDEGTGVGEEEVERIEFDGSDALGATMEIDLRGHTDTGCLEKPDAAGLANLKTLYALAEAIGGASDERTLMEKVVHLAVEAVDADAGYVFVRETDGKLQPKAILERRAEEGRKISRSIIKRVFKFHNAVLTSDASSDTRFRDNQSVVMKRIQSVICVPLSAFDKISGVLYLHGSRIDRAFNQQELELATAIGVQTGAAILNLQAAEHQQRMLMGAVKAMIQAYELRNPERRGHSGRVCLWATAMANELDLPIEQNHDVQLAALLHDAGKIVASDASGATRAGEGYRPEDHVHLGVDIVRNIEGMEGILPGIKHHHERWDGSGYPDGLEGDAIPLIARILAVADTFDHLSRENTAGIKGALVVMGKNEEGLFDERVVEALLLAYRNGTLLAPEHLLLDQFETSVD